MMSETAAAEEPAAPEIVRAPAVEPPTPKRLKDPMKVSAGRKGAAARKSTQQLLTAELREAKRSVAPLLPAQALDTVPAPTTAQRPAAPAATKWTLWIAGVLGLAGLLLVTSPGASQQRSSNMTRHAKLPLAPFELKTTLDPFIME